MFKKKVEIFDAQQILALTPTYDTDGSNITKVHFIDGRTFLVSCPVKKFIFQMLRHHQIHFGAFKEWVHSVTGAKSSFPILVDSDIVFLPFYARTCAISQDGVSGYVRSHFISSVSTGKITLENGTSLPLLSSTKCLFDKMKNGHYLSVLFTQGMGKNNFFSKHLPFDENVIPYREQS